MQLHGTCLTQGCSFKLSVGDRMDDVEVTPELLLMASQDHGYLEGHIVYLSGTTSADCIFTSKGD